jgi:hypothetical protein
MRLGTKVARYVLFALACGVACAQKSVADLEQAALKAHSEWLRLASDLDVRVARMLPCAAAATTAIENTRRAATVRILAVTDYVEAAAEQAAQDAALAQQLRRSQQLAAANYSQEATDSKHEVEDIEKQLGSLVESVHNKISLTTASDQLRSIEHLVDERAKLSATSADSAGILGEQFGELAAALQRREAALRTQVGELFDERGKWISYYNARLARARTECSATGAGR